MIRILYILLLPAIASAQITTNDPHNYDGYYYVRLSEKDPCPKCTANKATDYPLEPLLNPWAITNASTMEEELTHPIVFKRPAIQPASIQVIQIKFDYKRALLRSIGPASFCLAAGVAGGLREATMWKPTRFKNQQYWNHWISYTNRKRIDGSAADGYHDMYKLNQWSLYGAGFLAGVNIPASAGRYGRRWGLVGLDLAINILSGALMYYVGQGVTYAWK